MRVGFVGLGTMGFPMAQRILAAGHDLGCVSRSPGSAARLAEWGAIACKSAVDVVRRSEVTFLSLPGDSEVTAVVDSVLPVIAGKTLIDCSTAGPDTEIAASQRVRDAGGRYLDAPVSGGPAGAVAGRLAVMVGGDQTTFDDARTVMAAFASHIEYAGPAGAGQVVKLCNQVLVGAQVYALAECAELVRASAVDPAALYRAVAHSTGDSHMLRTRFPVADVVPDSPASNGWRPDFTTDLMLKDMRLAVKYAGHTGVPLRSAIPITAALSDNAAAGRGSLDWSSFAETLEGKQ